MSWAGRQARRQTGKQAGMRRSTIAKTEGRRRVHGGRQAGRQEMIHYGTWEKANINNIGNSTQKYTLNWRYKLCLPLRAEQTIWPRVGEELR